jgi:hypothetical protein
MRPLSERPTSIRPAQQPDHGHRPAVRHTGSLGRRRKRSRRRLPRGFCARKSNADRAVGEVKHAGRDAFAAEVAEFYKDHAAFVAQTLLLSLADAQGYCAGRPRRL